MVLWGVAFAAGDDFSRHDPKSEIVLDHSPWSKFLRTAVYDVGFSNREPAPRRVSGKQTGGRLIAGSKSKYRHEGNRILFRLFDEGAIAYVAAYREGVQQAVAQVGYENLNRDEQLAFWLNLYNAVVIHEIAKAHPIPQPAKIRIDGQKKRLFDAKLVVVNGVSLSLNEIRREIVFKYWQDPAVAYGFWHGTIGGPSIQAEAYTGRNLDRVLKRAGREFVNSLRGVSRSGRPVRVSKLYEDAKGYFAVWPTDLYDHLDTLADGQTAGLIEGRPANLRAKIYDPHTADLESGEIFHPISPLSPAALAGTNLPQILAGNRLVSNASTRGLSRDALKFIREVEIRREERETSVELEDIEPLTLEVAPVDTADESDEDSSDTESDEATADSD